MLKIRRSHNRLIYSRGIPIPVKGSRYIETGPGSCTLVCRLPEDVWGRTAGRRFCFDALNIKQPLNWAWKVLWELSIMVLDVAERRTVTPNCIQIAHKMSVDNLYSKLANTDCEWLLYVFITDENAHRGDLMMTGTSLSIIMCVPQACPSVSNRSFYQRICGLASDILGACNG